MSYDILRHIVYVSLNTSYFRELPCQFCHTLVYKCYLGICWGWWDFSERIQSVVYSIEQFQCQDAKTSEWLRSQYALKWTLFPLGLSPYFNFSEELCLQTYIGVTANDFKTRYRNNLKSPATQREVQARNGVIQPRLGLNLKKENRQFSIRWAIVKQIEAGRNGKRNCTLCILNRRSEMFTKCRHVI